MRHRKTQIVTCKECEQVYDKRVDTMATWNGLCKPCTTRTPEARLRSSLTAKRTREKYGMPWINLPLYGKQNPFYGKAHSEESIIKMRSAKSLYKGELHWNWKGGKTTEDRKERSKFSKYIQPKVLQRDNYTCQVCNVYGTCLNVDHIKKWSDYPELRFDITNCRTLCVSCHYYVTFKRNMPAGIKWGLGLSRRVG